MRHCAIIHPLHLELETALHKPGFIDHNGWLHVRRSSHLHPSQLGLLPYCQIGP